jgi:hypothetical protein
MYSFDSQTGSAADALFDVQSSLLHRNIVDDEPDWRVPGHPSAVALSASKVVATRWHASNNGPTQEFGAETPADCHVVKIVLRNTNIRFGVAGRTVQDGVTTPGTVHVTEPAVPVRCLFRGPYDVLHLHVPNTLIAECARDMIGHPMPVLCSNGVPRKDITVDALSRALPNAFMPWDSKWSACLQLNRQGVVRKRPRTAGILRDFFAPKLEPFLEP